jgi:WD40-like Beta Propeller Repeat
MPDMTPTPLFEDEIRAAVAPPLAREEFVKSLHARIMQQAATRSRPNRPVFLRLAWATVFVIAMLAVGILAIGPQRVFAAVRGLFGYIPGVGLVDQSAPIRVLAEPVSVTRDEISLTVTSATLTGDKTHIEYRIFGVPGSAYPDREDVMGCNQQPYLRLPDGTQLAPEKDYPPIPANVNQATLVLPCILDTLPGKVPENWELPLRFIPAPPDFTVVPVIESLPSITPSALASTLPSTNDPSTKVGSTIPSTIGPSTKAASTPTPEKNPLMITKVLDIGDKFVLMGEFSYNVDQNASLPAGSWWALQQVSITGADGRDVPQSYSNDFELPAPTQPDSEPWLYQLDKNFIPPVTITYVGEIISPVGAKEQAIYEFDSGTNPQNGGMWTANQNFMLGGYNIRLVSIESSSRGYFFHFKADPGASANAISVEISGYTPNCGGGGGGNDFPVEFDREVCYAGFTGAPEFPQGNLQVVINFQALTRQNKSFQIQWSPEPGQTGRFATPTPQPRVCLRSDSLAQINPVPADLASGKALVYEQLDGSGNWGLVLYNLDGSGKRVVTSNGNWGALSPDGSQVAYSATDNGIHLVDVSTQTDQVLPNTSGFNIHWSPDGTQIAYIGIGNGTINSVFIVKTDGTQVRQISDWSYETLIGWSPDGTQLYFAAPFTGGAAWKVYSYDIARGTPQERFTIENGTPKFLNPKLSPDGNWIAYRGRDNSSLYLVHPDGSDTHLVLDNIGVVGIEWSHTGWLGVSLGNPNTSVSTIVLLKPDGCEAYLLPTALHGDIEGLFTP